MANRVVELLMGDLAAVVAAAVIWAALIICIFMPELRIRQIQP